uniref:hypothetical protein n=1 Tax=Marinobacterium profundum TaxID=1714300 RepID=UPI000A666B85|nr:hypothetical protein [Marinobacterium profundum]
MAEIHLKSLAHSYSAKPAAPAGTGIDRERHVGHQGVALLQVIALNSRPVQEVANHG